MIKRALCVIMCCVIAAALSLSVFAVDLPRNDLAGSATLTDITVTDSTQSYSVTPNNECSFGTFNYFNLYLRRSTLTGDDITGVGIHIEVPVSINTQSTIYVAVSPIDSNFSISLPFESYAYPEGDISVTLPAGTYNSFDADLELRYSDRFTNFDTSSYSSYNSVDVVFRCFKNVPPTPSDTPYLVTYSADDKPSYDNHHDWIFPISFYISIPTFFDDFENGNITFNDAMNDIQSNLDDVLDSPTATDSEKLVALGVAQNDIERIKQISDVKYNGVVNDFISDADSIIDSYNNGTIDVNTAISDIQMTYFDALSQSVTPEQGFYINTANQIKLAELQLNWQSNYKEELDSVITDEDLEVNSEKLSHLDELHNQEMEVLSNFELAEFESKLEFSLWTDTLPSDYSNYKSIFEYFLEDNKAYQISQFLIVPFSLVLVSVLLATTTVVLRRNRNG